MPSQSDIDHQLSMLAINRRNLGHYLQQQARLGEAYTPPGVVNGIYEARSSIQRIKQILRGWSISVEDQPDDGSTAEIINPIGQANKMANIDRTRLRQILVDYFNEEELRDIAFDLNVDYDSLRSESNKASKARELIKFMETRNRFEELVLEVQRLRPNLT